MPSRCNALGHIPAGGVAAVSLDEADKMLSPHQRFDWESCNPATL
jgi:hypothetical protein